MTPQTMTTPQQATRERDEPARSLRTALLVLAVSLGSAGWAGAETHRFAAEHLTVENLIGEITIVGGAGAFEVEVQTKGADAARLRVVVEQGSRARLRVLFPEDERRFVYPRMEGGRTTFTPRNEGERGLLASLIHGWTERRVEVTTRGRGVEAWADVRISVPSGASLDLEHGVGAVDASATRADLKLRLRSGEITARDLEGNLTFDTGSGDVEVTAANGDLDIDTGSGDVRVASFTGPRLHIDTGSGSVVLAGIRSRAVSVDTGSGDVRAEGVEAEGCVIDTGSGEVSLALADMGTGHFDIDTGSGGITLLLPRHASAEVEADTGSGGIRVDLPTFRTLHRERNEMRFLVGNGDARVRLDAGSGSIRVASIE
jgi:lia operon protein LiaG